MSSRAIKDLRAREKATTIEIRVIKKWISTSKVSGIKKNELCYQFVDRNGDGIEATADGDKIEYFDKIIRLQSCYRVTGYVCTKPRDYMATINHPASLIIGKKEKFVPIESAYIPNIYFGFVSYEVLRGRIKVLTDFIGRVDRNYLRPTGKISAVRKVVLRDERRNKVEITLWSSILHLIGDHVGSGNIVAITATQVSNYYGSIQLEATYLTTVAINPEMPQTIEYTKRDLPPVDPNDEDDPIITVRELTIPDIAGKKHSTRFRCDACIEKFDLNRGWFYDTVQPATKRFIRRKTGVTPRKFLSI
ncbi:putative nucleic acid-binding protein [Helianthus debilis subsp. tardiflorus]